MDTAARAHRSATLILRGRVVTPTELLEDGVVEIRDGRILRVAPATPDEPVPASADLLLPGLVDLHCHGGGGLGFPDADSAGDAQVAAAEHLRHGTTTLIASLVTAPAPDLVRRTALLADLADAGVLAGIHLEGPFLSPARCGAQNPTAIQEMDPRLVDRIVTAGRGHVVTMTLAPEKDRADEVVTALVRGGAVPSLGHTDADAATVEDAGRRARSLLREHGVRGGVPTATHLFNGMRPIHHRDPGPAAACLALAARGDLVVELVADGVHVAPGMVRYVLELVGPEQVAFVTDAMAAAGMPDGDYVLGSQAVTVRDGVARLAESGTIAGGTSHLLDQVLGMIDAGVDPVVAVGCASQVPARVLRLEREIGALTPGLRGDAVVVAPDGAVRRVLRGGEDVTGL